MKKTTLLTVLVAVAMALTVSYCQAQPPEIRRGPRHGEGVQRGEGMQHGEGMQRGDGPQRGRMGGKFGDPQRQHPMGMSMDALGDVDARELVEMVRIMRISKELGLSDDQTIVIFKRHSEFRDEMGKLAQKRQETVAGLKRLLKSGSNEAKIEKQLQTLTKLDEEVLKKTSEGIKKMAEGLTVTQQAKLYVFVSEFPKDMRRIVDRARERGDQLKREWMGRQGMEGGRPMGDPPRGEDGSRGQAQNEPQRQPRPKPERNADRNNQTSE